MKNLPFLRFLQNLAFSDQLPMAPSRQFDVGFRGFPCALLKRMKHVDSLAELGDIEDTVFDSRVNPYFEYPLANTWHRFPIDRFQSLLYKTKTLSREASRIFRERPDIIERGSGRPSMPSVPAPSGGIKASLPSLAGSTFKLS